MHRLQNIVLFSCLSEEYINELKKISRIIKYSKNQIIFYEGEKPKNLFIVISGQINIYQTKDNFNEKILSVFNVNEMFAEAPCFEGFSYPASAKCVVDSEILEINYNKFVEIFLADKRVSFQIICGLSKKIKTLSRQVSSSNKSVINRLAEYLLYNDLQDIKHKEIAIKLGIAPETLSRNLSRLKKMGIVCGENIDMEKLTKFLN